MSETQYMSQQTREELETELKELREIKAVNLRKRIDEARQMGDLSENAEYHAAREELAWTQSRILEIKNILDNAEIITANEKKLDFVQIGSTIVVEVNKKEKEYMIVGAQEADPLKGKISNESPLGSAFLGKKKGEIVEVKTPSGLQNYKIVKIN
ncbi:MAG TPA: transcription elongation factor GreA [Candidatus Magasanikbacteria bacterium]|jgi:transcription elongation factor GreA|nr:transcription elongation factor GreA [Candidatus Magasanikbacteria bacterium]HQF57161.1 transcription elongation factor GreA [Candidatus Magasanikbacteria bacterium]HQL52511.1 transcription elongation factor GreA [Candidatus Magasanikbacteria bacterium]